MQIDENKRKALDLAIKQIDKAFGKGALVRLGDKVVGIVNDARNISSNLMLSLPLQEKSAIISPISAQWERNSTKKALSQFRLYLIIGGMPAAIMEYKSSSLAGADTQQKLLNLFLSDITAGSKKEPPATAAMPGSRSLHNSAEPAVNSSTPALQKVLLPKSIMNLCSG